MRNRISIGTRGSKLALWQAEWVKAELQKVNPGLRIDLIKIKTTGDKILDVPLANVGGKGLFVKEIEEALLRGDADLAVHSVKDVPTEFPSGLHLAAICKREDPRDALIVRRQKAKGKRQNLNPPIPPLVKGGKGGDCPTPPCPPLLRGELKGGLVESGLSPKVKSFKELPQGARIGTSSLRRVCQLLNIRPDLRVMQLRGNLDTRLRKLEEGQFDAVILAAAGIKRLGLSKRITEILSPEISLPAIGQGAIGIECRVEDDLINTIVNLLNHTETAICVRAERAFLKRLGGGCQVPIAAYARIINNPPIPPIIPPHPPLEKGGRGDLKEGGEGGLLIMDGLVGSVTGNRIVKGYIEGMTEESESIGVALAEDLLSRGAKKILEEVYGE
ncbi:MAG: hydroxymethylbilane synthase [Nitrospira sp.]|nr:hydroxymethylbilane synthase [Nitrospira sp.]